MRVTVKQCRFATNEHGDAIACRPPSLPSPPRENRTSSAKPFTSTRSKASNSPVGPAAYYDQLKQRGLHRHTIARARAYKWQRIMIRCWHNHQPYDETIYMQSLEKRNPTLHAAALKIILSKEKKTHDLHFSTCLFTSDIWFGSFSHARGIIALWRS